MRLPAHSRTLDGSDANRPLLHALLGLVSSLAMFDGLLAEGGPERAGPAESAGDDGVLMAVLGLIALRRTCGRHLSSIAANAHASVDRSSPPTRATGVSGSLLR